MKAGSEGHGQSIYAVADSEGSALQGQVRFFDDDGELAPELIHLDLESLTVGICSRADRQLRVTQLSPYKRYFGQAGQADTQRLALLQRLGAAMQFNDFADVVGDIPAGYTYLGQFIFHDLSSMIEGPVATRPKNLRSAALDLDSVFGSPNQELENGQSLHCPAPMATGETTYGELRDIPRSAEGIPVIADQRNDSNLPLAQVHMALIRFFNAVSRVCESNAEAKRMTQLHLQSVALHDYASRIVDDEVYHDVMTEGRAIIHIDREAFLLPLEFAAACARFGHSMVRNRYDWNASNPGGHLYAFWGNTYISAADPIARLPGDWIADWRRLFGVGMGPGETPILAARIGTRLAFPLKNIKQHALPRDTGSKPFSSNLAVRTLQRGCILELGSAQDVYRGLHSMLSRQNRPTFTLLTEDELLEGESPEVRAILTERPDDGGPKLVDCTPLWFYVLKEAQVRNRGLKLGPLGGRIVMETLHAAVAEARPSILRPPGGGQWQPDPRLNPSSPTRYTFGDLIAFSGLESR
ncbi:hypothetical protein [Allomesorhizobium camelthorni]|uniref:Peroxidase n=1 Tax=Allomesorhizobium camelthorni TaxID=475069 RepID=A0A6G4WIV2_9HYPH|nr:hypothetical protein [Mesorhizobium camelthorni]NGO54050.1 hypothetical protein [Mesorhizobium camelthorni]